MIDRLAELYRAKAIATAIDRQREPYEVVEAQGILRRNERRSFLAALKHSHRVSLIAEIKRASPSVGLISTSFDARVVAANYQAAQVDAISVLTEASAFLGDLTYLDIARSQTTCPILRKDFLSQPYEIAQAAAYGADAVLLIVAGLSDSVLQELLLEARRFALDALVEVHTLDELTRALQAGAQIIGINNRNLHDFSVDLHVTEVLAPCIPQDCCIITESGITTPHDIERALACNVDAALIGEAAMRSLNLPELLSSFRALTRPKR